MEWREKLELPVRIEVVEASRGEEGEISVRDGFDLERQIIETFLEVNGIPSDNRIGEQSETGCLIGEVFRVRMKESGLTGKEGCG